MPRSVNWDAVRATYEFQPRRARVQSSKVKASEQARALRILRKCVPEAVPEKLRSAYAH